MIKESCVDIVDTVSIVSRNKKLGKARQELASVRGRINAGTATLSDEKSFVDLLNTMDNIYNQKVQRLISRNLALALVTFGLGSL